MGYNVFAPEIYPKYNYIALDSKPHTRAIQQGIPTFAEVRTTAMYPDYRRLPVPLPISHSSAQFSLFKFHFSLAPLGYPAHPAI